MCRARAEKRIQAMPTPDRVRRLALSLPEATEQDHFGINSFRVRKKIFATVPDAGHIRIMVDEPEILAAVAEDPASCEPMYWGKRPACVVVNIRTARVALLRELLTEAWLRKAPKSLGQSLTDRGRIDR
jgi:hypothetical protein